MVRSELLQKLCDQHPNLLRRDIKRILHIIFDEISKALCKGENIEIRGFGMLKIVLRKARIGKNPKSLEMVQIPEKRIIRWKMSKNFFIKLNKNFTENKISDTY
tara:strand:+ start:297 stop:608 length:312 start_codon:yes stop_codon:yes gene_type:complete